MFQLNDDFLNSIGLNDMPEDQKKPFLQHIYSELEMRVGTKLSDGMSDDQLEEFGNIIDRNDAVIVGWLQKYAPDYYNDESFSKIQEATGLDVNDAALRAEYAATKWLEVNRPDYKDVVAQVMNEIKNEVASNRDAILGNTAA
ncbi:hypothetical protein CVV43_00985 [Candidatus Saccharibacteria bacterium HGW-Saccharibacteria-1]|jgi:succinate dehydrogenase flavin-adding protein (antitoxin of CptAB toxin-antitoxin module)|nr:MAG: hypothetical protein CVV43_00985 [Candidatus Saccharibacteria bacterium HGW-Saccharibacteria-1]